MKSVLRFAKVFGQIYQRFLDLQKAEAQAREAQIEAALERVRSRSMGMQKSEELFEVGAVLYRELCRLGVENLTTGYVLFDEKARIGYSHGVNPADGAYSANRNRYAARRDCCHEIDSEKLEKAGTFVDHRIE